MSLQPRDLFATLPGLVAIGVGLLYGTGAVIKSGQLRTADLNVRDTLPLIPLEQLLAVGIGTIVTSLVWVFVFAFILWIYLGREADYDRERQAEEHEMISRCSHLTRVPVGLHWMEGAAPPCLRARPRANYSPWPPTGIQNATTRPFLTCAES